MIMIKSPYSPDMCLKHRDKLKSSALPSFSCTQVNRLFCYFFFIFRFFSFVDASFTEGWPYSWSCHVIINDTHTHTHKKKFFWFYG